MFYVLQCGAIYRVETSDNKVVSSTRITTRLPVDTTSAAPFGNKDVYFVTKSAPQLLYRLNLADEGSAAAASLEHVSLPEPCTDVLVSANKVYCLTQSRLVSLDPLCSQLEEFPLPEAVAELKAAGNGFVARTPGGRLYTFQFGVGFEPAETTATRILGQAKRHSVVLVDSDTIASVPLEGPAQVIKAPGLRELASAGISSAGDETSGSLVLLTTDAKILRLRPDPSGSSWSVDEVSGFDVKVDVEARILSVSTADPVETCGVCMDDIDGDAITLDCGHAFHTDCVQGCVAFAEKYVETGTRIIFNMATCPGGCGRIIRHQVNPRSTVISERYRKVRALAMARAQAEYPNENPTEVMDKYLYYLCHRCKQPFWGGNKDCARTIGGEPTNDPTRLICEDCQDDFRCPAHNREFVVYKCMYCCNPATHLSFGTQRVCDRCHVSNNKTAIPCPRDPTPCCLPAGHASENTAPLGCFACLTTEQLDVSRIVPPPPPPATGN